MHDDDQHHRARPTHAAAQPPHEQIGYLQEGEGDLYMGDEKVHIKAQCSFVAPGGVPHNFDATGDKPAVLIECFAPPREDYLERVKKEAKKK